MVNLDRRVVCAANRYDETIILGARHWDVLMRNMHERIYGDNCPLEECSSEWEQGFVNTEGDFLTREEAWIVAVRNMQVLSLVGNQAGRLTNQDYELFSENLY